ncbi:lysozyme, partial [Acinetobacter baumannii]|nr:lysozyme [Acinetobacter baumannii]
YVAKRDCSIRKNGCYGVWTRQLERHAKCIGAQ